MIAKGYGELLSEVIKCSKIDCSDGCTAQWIYWATELYTLMGQMYRIMYELYLKSVIF